MKRGNRKIALFSLGSKSKGGVAVMAYLRDPDKRNELWQRDSGECGLCKNPVFDSWEADHVVPMSKGGNDDLDNFQVSHPTCNKRKGNRGVL